MLIYKEPAYWKMMAATVVIVGMSVWAFSLQAQQLLPPSTFISETNTFGMLGLAPGQVARLSVLNPGSDNAPASTQFSCAAELAFLDSQGTIIKSVTSQLGAGKATYADLDRNEISPASDRVQIRATVRALPAPTAASSEGVPACTLIPTLEVFDKGTGKTAFILTQPSMVPPSPFATRAARSYRPQ